MRYGYWYSPPYKWSATKNKREGWHRAINSARGINMQGVWLQRLGRRTVQQVEGKEQLWCCSASLFGRVPLIECSSHPGHFCRKNLKRPCALLHFFTKWTPASSVDIFQVLLFVVLSLLLLPLLILFNNKTFSFYFIRIFWARGMSPPKTKRKEKRFHWYLHNLTVYDFKSQEGRS